MVLFPLHPKGWSFHKTVSMKEFIHYIITSEEDKVIKYRNQYINELSEIQYKIL